MDYFLAILEENLIKKTPVTFNRLLLSGLKLNAFVKLFEYSFFGCHCNQSFRCVVLSFVLAIWMMT